MKKLAGVVFGILIIIIIAALIFLNLPKANVKNKEAAFTLSATELYEAFETNESEANKKFIGETIIVEGKVLTIERDEQGAPVVILDGGASMGGVMCTFSGKKSVDTEPGETVRIKGLCTGVLMDVVLNKCILLDGK